VAFESKSLSLTKVVAAVGGLLLVAAFFLPAVDVKAGGAVARDMFGVKAMRAQIEASRDLTIVQPLIEPALASYEAFAATPSLRNLSTLCGVSKEILDITLTLPVPHQDEIRMAARVLGEARLALWLLPLVGLVQLVAPLITLLRGNTGFIGLVSRFAFGLVLMFLAALPALGVSDAERPFIGPAVWALLLGSGLMVGAGVCGVTRDNWWYVWLVQAATLAGLIGFIVLAVQVANS
jgi:hypothetical protein